MFIVPNFNAYNYTAPAKSISPAVSRNFICYFFRTCIVDSRAALQMIVTLIYCFTILLIGENIFTKQGF